MLNEPKISIVIPTYNRISFLKRSIASVRNQGSNNWELIVVDDGSSDGTTEFVHGLNEKRITYLKKENSGAGHSRNVGAEAAKGDYLLFLDSDDEMINGLLKTMEAEIEKDQVGIIFCGFERWKNGRRIKIQLPFNLGPVFQNETGSFVAGSFLVNKECFKEIGGYDLELPSGQHTELLMRLIPYCTKHCYKVKNIPEPLLRIHVHNGERIRTNHRAIYLGTKRIYYKHLDLLNKSKKDRANYLKVIGYNASLLGYQKEAYCYYLESFKINPTFWGLLRLIKYRAKFF